MALNDPQPTAEPDLITTTELGKALFKFLAGRGEEPDLDQFTWEDAGVSIAAGFIELDPDVALRVKDLLDADFDS